jgi:hypothetical protein
MQYGNSQAYSLFHLHTDSIECTTNMHYDKNSISKT